MSYTFELNQEVKSGNFATGQVSEKSPVVEVFSAMAQGKDLEKFGKKADAAVKYIQELSQKASVGDVHAKSELNEIRRFAIQPVLMAEMKLLGIYGNYRALGFNDTAEIEIPVFANVDPKVQALGQDVTFPVIRKERKSIQTTTISGGYAVDYRKAALGDMTLENQLLEEVRKSIRNKANNYVVKTIYDAIINATGVKYTHENAGLTKAGIDAVIAKVRKFGKPTITGDYALVSQLNDFVGFNSTVTGVAGISDKLIDEINDNGLLGIYKGAIVSELDNPYDLSQVVGTGANKNFATVQPQGLGYVIPAGTQSPIYTITRGGLTSATGFDVTSGTEMTRFDLEVGALVAPNQEYKIGLIHDTNLDDLA